MGDLDINNQYDFFKNITVDDAGAIKVKIEGGNFQKWKYTATNYTDLTTNVAPTATEGDLAMVYESQGVWLINRKLKGVYIYQSSVWVYANEELQTNAEQNDLDHKRFGFVDYNDASTSSSPVSLSAGVWTDVPNDKLGAFTNTTYTPDGVSTLMDGSTGYLDFSDLTLGSDLLIRIDFEVTPNTNNSLLETRYVLGQGANEYPLPVRSRRLDSGSGIAYASEKGSFYIYMGDSNTLGGVGKLQVKLSTNGTLKNNGVAIKVFKR